MMYKQFVHEVTDLLTLNTKHTSGMLLCQKEEVNQLRETEL